MKKLSKVLISVSCVAFWIVLILASVLFVPSDSLLIAHRGYGKTDNTLAAFENSTRFSGVETDVQITADGEFVLSHNDEVTFDDGCNLSIKNSNFEDFSDKTFSNGDKICTLVDFLKLCKEKSFIALIELKASFSQEQCRQIADLIDEYYNKTNCIIQSFDRGNLLNFKAVSDIKLFYLFTLNNKQNIDFCITNDINASICWNSCTTNLITKMHKNDLEVACWTIKGILSNFWAKIIGADYIISDIYVR